MKSMGNIGTAVTEAPFQRVLGLESELAVNSGEAAIAKRIVSCGKRISGVYSIGDFLSNGARLYEDVGGHVEYATPECLTVRQLSGAEMAGQAIMQTAAESAGVPYALNTRVVDDNGNVWGSHENYLVDRELPILLGNACGILATHLATRNVLCGAGVVAVGSNSLNYFTSQKLHTIQLLLGEQTTTHRPLINKRDEPHADKEKFRRLHLICGDPTMSPWSLAYRLASTSLVLRLIEHNRIPTHLIVDDPLTVLRIVGRDTTLK
jgi:hypothetical protein